VPLSDSLGLIPSVVTALRHPGRFDRECKRAWPETIVFGSLRGNGTGSYVERSVAAKKKGMQILLPSFRRSKDCGEVPFTTKKTTKFRSR
jgi:hypothetical protein